MVHTIACVGGGSEQAGDDDPYCEAKYHDCDCAGYSGDPYEEDIREGAGTQGVVPSFRRTIGSIWIECAGWIRPLGVFAAPELDIHGFD